MNKPYWMVKQLSTHRSWKSTKIGVIEQLSAAVAVVRKVSSSMSRSISTTMFADWQRTSNEKEKETTPNYKGKKNNTVREEEEQELSTGN